MKSFFFVLIALGANLCCSAQIKPIVDPRLELIGIVFYLSGAEEYADIRIPQYREDVESYFGQYRDHPLMAYIREIRDTHSIGYNAAADSGLALAMEGNNISVSPTISPENLTFDTRWDTETFLKYVELLNDFCHTTDFWKFYNSQTKLYDGLLKASDTLLADAHLEWFETFWGQKMLPFNLYLSPASSKNNYAVLAGYGLDADDKPGVILGCNKADATGTPYFNISDLTILFHEFCHHFTNPLYDSYEQQLQEDADKIFPYVKTMVSKIGYGDAGTMLGEGTNELFVNMYLQQYESDWMRYRIEWDENNGFVWMSKAVRFMKNFTDNRGIYPTIREFMPRLVTFFHTIAADMDSVMIDFENRHPSVVSSSPAQNAAVSIDEREIIVKFSQPLYIGINGVREVNPEIPLPNIVETVWTEDGTSYILKISEPMKPNTTYGIRLPYAFFIDNQTGHRLKEDFVLIFTTKSE